MSIFTSSKGKQLVSSLYLKKKQPSISHPARNPTLEQIKFGSRHQAILKTDILKIHTRLKLMFVLNLNVYRSPFGLGGDTFFNLKKRVLFRTTSGIIYK